MRRRFGPLGHVIVRSKILIIRGCWLLPWYLGGGRRWCGGCGGVVHGGYSGGIWAYSSGVREAAQVLFTHISWGVWFHPMCY